jgi:hypothetical protein
MTTIIGIKLPDRAVIYSDNQVTSGHLRYNDKRMVKITKRGDFLIAGAGEVLACDIAQHLFEPPSPTPKDYRNLYHFMIAKVMPALRACLKDNAWNFDAEVDDDYRFRFLFAINGEIFEIDDDLSVCVRDDGFYGIGSGSEFALGALHAGATPRKALEIAANLDVYTSKPFMKRESRVG